MAEYKVVPHKSRRFSGTLNDNALEKELNQHGGDGWRFVRSIHETERRWLFFSREAHFLVFEREK